jgi:hypothetical protein
MNDTTAQGTYTMNLFGSLNPYLNLTHKFFLEVEIYPNTAAPSFVTQLEEIVKVSLQSDKRFKLPDIKDPDDDSWTLEIYYLGHGRVTQTLPDFIYFDALAN